MFGHWVYSSHDGAMIRIIITPRSMTIFTSFNNKKDYSDWVRKGIRTAFDLRYSEKEGNQYTFIGNRSGYIDLKVYVELLNKRELNVISTNDRFNGVYLFDKRISPGAIIFSGK